MTPIYSLQNRCHISIQNLIILVFCFLVFGVVFLIDDICQCYGVGEEIKRETKLYIYGPARVHNLIGCNLAILQSTFSENIDKYTACCFQSWLQIEHLGNFSKVSVPSPTQSLLIQLVLGESQGMILYGSSLHYSNVQSQIHQYMVF